MSVVADDIVRIATVDKARGYWTTVFRRLSPVLIACAAFAGTLVIPPAIAP